MPKKRKDFPDQGKRQIHDAVFKVFFSDTKIAKNYLVHFTPETVHGRIDFDVFQKSDTTFVSGRFGISFGDVVYETRLLSGLPARVLFLFEHKSYLPSFPVHLQLLDYLLQIWEDDLKNRRPCSFVVPIVVYHGKQHWEQKHFHQHFPGLPEDWQSFIPDFRYLLTDLSRMHPEEIDQKAEAEFLRNLFLALKFAHNQDQLFKYWSEILTFGEPFYQNDRAGILLQTLTLYVFNLFDMTEAQVKSLNKQLPEAEENWIDAIPAIFGDPWKQKGLQEGRQQGLQEGLEQGRADTVRKMTIKMLKQFPDWSDAQIAEFVGSTEETVCLLRQNPIEEK